MTPAPQNARAVLAKSASEDDLLRALMEAAVLYGWLIHHDRRSDQANPQWGSHTGFPDLVLSRNGVTTVAELKAEREQPTAAQFAWLQAMGYRGDLGVGEQKGWPFLRVFIWRPSDLDAALAELARP